MDTIQQVVSETFSREADRILAALIGTVRDFELAEDALQDALLVALERWSVDGIPHNPSAWITTTARHKAIDRLRRENTLARKQVMLQVLLEHEEQRGEEDMEKTSIPDDRLKLMFTCCHPTLALEAQVALTLHTLGGLSTAEVARAFLVPVPTMAQRLDALLGVIYLIFNEGYVATLGVAERGHAGGGDPLTRPELCGEAIRLGRVLVGLLPASAEAHGLLALMLLHDS